MPLSGGEAEPARRVGGVEVTRLGAVGRIQIQPAASWTPQEDPPVVVRGDLSNMAEAHVLVVATEIASSFAHADNGKPMLVRSLVIAAAILRQLHAVVTTGQTWDPTSANGTRLAEATELAA